MKKTCYIITRAKGSNQAEVYCGGRNTEEQFSPLSFPKNLGRLFERRCQAYQRLGDLKKERYYKYNINKVIIELSDPDE